MSKVAVMELPSADYEEWADLVGRSPDGSIYSLPEYLDVLCTHAGGRFRVIGVRRGEELVGGVALYEQATPFGRFVSPRLLLYYNGIVLRRYETKHPSQATSRTLEALGALESWLTDAAYGAIHLKNRGGLLDVRAFTARGWDALPSYTYVLPIGDLERLWERMDQNLRRLVKRCGERDGVSFHPDEDFDAFYRLHEVTLGRRDLRAYLPEEAFRRYFTRLHSAGLARLYHARVPDGRPIASQLVLLGNHPVSHTVSAAGDPEFSRLGAQAFLRWKVCEALSAGGYTGNDLTDAALNSVTRFKAQLGGDLTLSFALKRPDRAWYRWGNAMRQLPRRGRGALRRLVRPTADGGA